MIVGVMGVSTVGKTDLSYRLASIFECSVACGDGAQMISGFEKSSGSEDRNKFPNIDKLWYGQFTDSPSKDEFALMVERVSISKEILVLDSLTIYYYEAISGRDDLILLGIRPPSWNILRELMYNRLNRAIHNGLLVEIEKNKNNPLNYIGVIPRHLIKSNNLNKAKKDIIDESINSAIIKQEKLEKIGGIHWINFEKLTEYYPEKFN